MNDAPPPLSPSSQPAPQYQQAPPRKSGCGLGGIGCGLGCLVIVGLCVALGIFAVVAGKNWVEEKIGQYTAVEAVPVEAPVATAEEISAAVQQFDAFQQGMSGGGAPVPLAVTGRELNLILFHHPAFEPIAGRASVDIVDDQIRAKVSLAFDELPLPQEGFLAERLKGKFFNGEASLSLGMTSGRPALYAEELSVNGLALPEAFMSRIRAQNLMEEAAKDPDASKFFDRIEDMRIEGGRFLIVPKATPGKALP